MRHFSTEKFKSFLLAGTFTAFIGYANRLSDSVIIGHVIGEDALAGLKVNVPGDRGDEKKLLGLRKPQKRNEGGAELNIRMASDFGFAGAEGWKLSWSEESDGFRT